MGFYWDCIRLYLDFGKKHMFKRWGSIEIHQLQITKKQTNKTEILKDYTQKESKKSFRLDSKKKAT